MNLSRIRGYVVNPGGAVRLGLGVGLVLCLAVGAARTVAGDLPIPDAWTVDRGADGPLPGLEPEIRRHGRADQRELAVHLTQALQLPLDVTLHVLLPQRSGMTVEVGPPGSLRIRLNTRRDGAVVLYVDDTAADLTAPAAGSVPYTYAWRRPAPRAWWSFFGKSQTKTPDHFAGMQPLDKRPLALRLVVTDAVRQVWIDGRLVDETPSDVVSSRDDDAAEDGDAPPTATLAVTLIGGASLGHAATVEASHADLFLPLDLDAWSAPFRAIDDRVGDLGGGGERIDVADHDRHVPFRLPTFADTDLGLHLGSGSTSAAGWPGALELDPMVAAFRVPWRPWRAVWLLVRDDATDADAALATTGRLSFYATSGAPIEAGTDFAVVPSSDEPASREIPGLGVAGARYRLVRVAVNQDAFQAFRSRQGMPLDFRLDMDRVPVGVNRHRPHIAAITLESFPVDVQLVAATSTFAADTTPTVLLRLDNLGNLGIPGAPSAAVIDAGSTMVNVQYRFTATLSQPHAATPGDAPNAPGTPPSDIVEGHLPLEPRGDRDVPIAFTRLPLPGDYEVDGEIMLDGVVTHSLRRRFTWLPPPPATVGEAP